MMDSLSRAFSLSVEALVRPLIMSDRSVDSSKSSNVLSECANTNFLMGTIESVLFDKSVYRGMMGVSG